MYVNPRNSCDLRTNAHGRKLLQLMTNHDMLLANGRLCGDIAGNFTCCHYNGCSVVDVFIVQRDLIPLLSYFNVKEFDWYSDHAVISACIAVEVNRSAPVPADWKRVYNLFQNWDDTTKNEFVRKLSDPIISDKLNTFCQTNFTCSRTATDQFTDILSSVIKSLFRRSRRRRPHTDRKIPFDRQLRIAKRSFKKYKDRFAKDPDNSDRRIRYIKERRLYKKLVYSIKKKCRESKLHKIAGLEQADPKCFWRNIKKLLSSPEDGPSMIRHPNWFSHFSGLLNTAFPGSTDPQFAEYVAEALPLLESHAELATTLNGPVTGVELRYVMKSLKPGKATYLDDVSNDAIKAGFPVIQEALVHLFNNVLNSQIFPEPWNEGLIIPIHNKGDKLNTDNHRGIIISSCIGKLFLKVMTSRIESHMDRLHRWCDNQCGFKKDHRTEDNLYILNSVYESHVSRGKGNIYLAFVDFTKFVDTINREILYHKLLKYGICGPIYHIIKSMYSATSYRVKI